MPNRMKNGMLARMGLYAAIAGFFGRVEKNATIERRKKIGSSHHRSGKSRKEKGMSGAPHRAGFKLYKKMCRRPYSPPMAFGRKERKYQMRGFGFMPQPQKKGKKEAIHA